MATPQSGSEEQCLSSCPGAEEIIPVCGSNGVTYNNPTELLCAQFCGQGNTHFLDFKICISKSILNNIIKITGDVYPVPRGSR